MAKKGKKSDNKKKAQDAPDTAKKSKYPAPPKFGGLD